MKGLDFYGVRKIMSQWVESEKSGFVNKMSEIWRKMQVKNIILVQ